MEKFILTGKKDDKLFEIFLPDAKIFKPPNTDPDLLPPAYSVKEKSTEELAELDSKLKVLAFKPNSMFKGHQWFHGPTLENNYANHSYPIAQGPAIPPLDKDNSNSRENKSYHQVFADRTEFTHSSEDCFEWIPTRIGIDVLGKINKGDSFDKNKITAGFEVRESQQLKIKGAASLRDMSIVYTCKFHNCILHCPCTVCVSVKGDCKTICKENVCVDCTSQCTQHEVIGLSRLFNPNKDHFTMITDKLDFFRYVIPYPGILLSCNFCTNNVIEHQTLHHVFHLRCKFCRLEARPYEVLIDSSLKDFKKAVMYYRNKDNSTCSHCFLLLRDSYDRKNHEKKVHLERDSKFKCEICHKSYLCKVALTYHMEKHKEESQKFSCDECGKQYASQQGLTTHKEILHGSKLRLQLPCCHCDALFTNVSNLNRHEKSVHEDPVNLNIDFIPSTSGALNFQCLFCEKEFNRKDALKRHMQSVHGDVQKFECEYCSSKFQRKDVLKRHIKLLHNN